MSPAPLPPPAASAGTDLEAELAAYRQELEAEHDARVSRFHERRSQAERAQRRAETARVVELNQRKAEMLEAFHREKGYQRYIDSTGREVWLPPEEYAARQRRRRRRPRAEADWGGRWRGVALYGGLFLAALVVGLLIAR